MKQQYQIQVFYDADYSYQKIADKVGCHKSIISREVWRGKQGQYCAEKVYKQALKKKAKHWQINKFQ
ncbi:helix-turn-helix domain-containing protein [Sinobacterium caligoides]|uniref:helix-turn-helix domain-containing protein n=1 Tax=Sinobacterium caligoides TaxID=933926 RepID=UPI0013C2DEA9